MHPGNSALPMVEWFTIILGEKIAITANCELGDFPLLPEHVIDKGFVNEGIFQ